MSFWQDVRRWLTPGFVEEQRERTARLERFLDEVRRERDLLRAQLAVQTARADALAEQAARCRCRN